MPFGSNCFKNGYFVLKQSCHEKKGIKSFFGSFNIFLLKLFSHLYKWIISTAQTLKLQYTFRHIFVWPTFHRETSHALLCTLITVACSTLMASKHALQNCPIYKKIGRLCSWYEDGRKVYIAPDDWKKKGKSKKIFSLAWVRGALPSGRAE